MKRRMAREEAVCLVFEIDFNKCVNMDEIISNALEVREIDKDEHMLDIVTGVFKNKEEIDSIIEKNLKDWKLTRLSKVSLAIIRVACYEILFCEDVPDSVAINEAVEIAKAYESTEAASFINGLLGTVVREK